MSTVSGRRKAEKSPKIAVTEDKAKGCIFMCSDNFSIPGAKVLLSLAQQIINPEANPLILVGNNSDM